MLLFLAPGPFAYTIVMEEGTVTARNGLSYCYYTVAWNIYTHISFCIRAHEIAPPFVSGMPLMEKSVRVSSLSTKRSVSGIVRNAGPQRFLRYSFVFG